MRIIFYIFLTIISLIISTIIIAPSIFDINTYKKKIVQTVYNETGYNFEIKGPIKLSVFPKAKIYIRNVRLFKESSAPLFTSEKMYIYPSIIEILKGQISFDKITIEKALINIVKTKNKKNSGEIQQKKNKNVPVLDSSPKGILDEKQNDKEIKDKNLLKIKRVEIKDSFLKYTNINQVYDIKNINLNIDKKNSFYNLKGSLFYKYKMKLNYKITSTENYDFNLKGNLLSDIGFVEKDLRVNSNQSNFIGNITADFKDVNSLIDLKLKDNLALLINTEIEYNKNKLKFTKTTLKSSGNEIKASGSIINDKKKNINIVLNAKTLDLNKFLLRQKTSEKIIKEKSKKLKNNVNKKDWTNELIGKELAINKNIVEKFNIIENYNFNIKTKIDNLKYKDYEIGNFKGSLNKKNNINILMSGTHSLLGKVKIASRLDKNGIANFEISSSDTNLETFTGKDLTKIIVGKCDTKSSFTFNLYSNKNLYENISGTSKLNFKNLTLKNINIKGLKNKISNLKKIEDISVIATHAFKGDTTIKNQNISLRLEKGAIILPISKIVIDENIIMLKGQYNILKADLNANINFDNEKNNRLLSLFGIRMSGKSSDIKKKIIFDQRKLQIVFEKKAKKKLEKMIKKKLEKKFDNVIENLLN